MFYELRDTRADAANMLILAALGTVVTVYSSFVANTIGIVIGVVILASAFYTKRLSVDKNNIIMTTKLAMFIKAKTIPVSDVKILGVEQTERDKAEVRFTGIDLRMKGVFSKNDVVAITRIIEKKAPGVRIVETPERKKYKLYLIKR